jgi:hypothetical protein
MAGDKGRKSRSDDLLDWFTISYRTIYLIAGSVIAIVGAAGYYFYVKNQPVASAEATPAPVATTTARFTSIDGNVKVRAVGSFEWVTADKDVILKRGDLVKTGSGSTSEITFFDGTVVHVRPESLITIEETSENPATKERRVAWHISSGEVTFTAPRRKDDGRTDITTPLTRLTTKDEAEGAIGVAESGESSTRLFRGQADLEMTKTGEKVALGPKEAVKIDSDGRVSDKVLLPSVPELISPADQADLAYADPTRAITPFIWKEVAGARSYRLVLDFSHTFNKPLHDKPVGEKTAHLTGLDAGRYFWRVAAIDSQGNEGGFSEPGRFRVTKLQANAGVPPPALVISSVETRANILQIKGRTEPGATVSVNGQPLDVESDGSFNEFITLDKAGAQHITIMAVGINGGVNKKLERVVVTF